MLFFHAGFGWFPGGFVGVDVFFVISGYLITSIILDDLSAGTFSVWGFYERRVRRIMPALLFVCLATLPLAWIWMVPQEFDDYAQSLFAVPLSVSNFLFWRETDYFAASAEMKPLLHTWSLGVEEQFYLIFPVLILLCARRRLVLPGVVAVLCAVSFGLTQVFASFDPVGNFYLLPTRFWELGLGALLAFSNAGERIRDWRLAEIISVTGLGLIAASILMLSGKVSYPGVWTLLPVLGSLMVLATVGHRTFAGRLLSWRPLVVAGLISYSTYLWHQPLFAFARIRMFGEVSLWLYACLIALTLVLSYATWRWVERPFRGRTRFTRMQIFASASIVGLGIAAFGVVADQLEGLPMRHPDRAFAASIEERMRENAGLSIQCIGDLPLSAECHTSDAPEIIVWGDSFAMHIVAGIIASKPDAALVQFTKPVCGPFIDYAPIVPPGHPVWWARQCQAFNDEVKAYISMTKSLKYAVLASPFNHYFSQRGLLDGKVVKVSRDLILTELRRTLEWLSKQGIKPVVFSPSPTNGHDLGACLIRAKWFGESGDRCDFSRAVADKLRANARFLMDGIRGDYRVIDPDRALCDETRCKAVDGDTLIFRDVNHYSYEGSRYLGIKMNFYERITGNAD